MSLILVNSDSLHIPLADNSVQTCVTSPPYWGLRDYGVPGQLGLEPTPEQYVADMVAVFREVRRVLRDDGTCWMNLGDSYWGGKGKSGYELPDEAEARRGLGETMQTGHNIPGYMDMRPQDGKHETIKPKDLVGIPWRVAFALQADGWYLRSDCIWHKPNPMPESVTDRPTKAHEYVFLLTKNARYYFDQDAVREEHARDWWNETVGDKYMTAQDGRNDGGKREGNGNPAGRNIRTVWTIATQPTPFAHFATYPEKLVEPCIKAGTSERGRCPKCGKAWVRVTEKEKPPASVYTSTRKPDNIAPVSNPEVGKAGMGQKLQDWYKEHPTKTTGWQPSCTCAAGDPLPCVVLDPFAGSGTTGIVARRLGRHFVGLDLSRVYLHDIARRRLELDKLDDWSNSIRVNDDGWHDLPMFQTEAPHA